MPLFEYKCISCNHTFESLRKLGDRNPSCKECGCKTNRLVSATGYRRDWTPKFNEGTNKQNARAT